MADHNGIAVSEERQAAGGAILDLTDRFGFDALPAAWLYDRPTDTWRYLLVTQMLRSEGPAWIYSRLLRLFRHYQLPPGASPLDVYVIDDVVERTAFGDAVIAVEQSAPGTRMIIAHPVQLENFIVSDGFVAFFRRLPMRSRESRANPAKRFNKTIQKLAA